MIMDVPHHYQILRQFSAPHWCSSSSLSYVPHHKLNVFESNFPTPIQKWHFDLSVLTNNGIPPLPCLQAVTRDATPHHVGGSGGGRVRNIYIKRDDYSGLECTGNKLRKLQFLLAQVVANKHDSVITVGGMQSNHCRATVALARQIGLPSYLILYTDRLDEEPSKSNDNDNNMGVVEGNLLLCRLLGATVYMCSTKQLKEEGWDSLGNQLLQKLRKEGKNPYFIPVGGSNALGTWGYLSAADEILNQIKQSNLEIDDIVVATGSGATVGGLGLGMKLAGSNIKVYGVPVCNDAKHFYKEINAIYAELGARERAEDVITLLDGYKGVGYAKSSASEIALLHQIAQTSGVLLDPTYTLKAFSAVLCDPSFHNRNVLFVHTGGIFSLFAKTEHFYNELQNKRIHRL